MHLRNIGRSNTIPLVHPASRSTRLTGWGGSLRQVVAVKCNTLSPLGFSVKSPSGEQNNLCLFVVVVDSTGCALKNP